MKETIELLKKEGIIDKLQKSFDEIKPPKGTSEEIILSTISSRIMLECVNREGFEDAFFDALLADAVQHIRNELNIEFIEKDEFVAQAVPGFLSALFEHGNVCFHVVCAGEKMKGQGEE